MVSSSILYPALDTVLMMNVLVLTVVMGLDRGDEIVMVIYVEGSKVDFTKEVIENCCPDIVQEGELSMEVGRLELLT